MCPGLLLVVRFKAQDYSGAGRENEPSNVYIWLATKLQLFPTTDVSSNSVSEGEGCLESHR